MATQTTNYKLTKPAAEDFYDIGIHNANMEIIDAELKRISDATPTRAVTTSYVQDDLDFNTLPTGTVKDINVTGNVDVHSPISSGWVTVETFGLDDASAFDRVVQIAHAPYSANKKSFIRYKHDSVWTEWSEIYTSTNKPTVEDIGALPQDTITAGTTDLTAGTSALADGKLYIVYE